MNQFVDECRREWRRLGVPDPVAAEMAADLAADLEEAEADGASAEEVLGSGAFDPRSFAAAWAVERGVIGRSRQSEDGPRRRAWMPAAIAALALVAIVGAVLVVEASTSADSLFPRLALTPHIPPPAGVDAVWVVAAPEPPAGSPLVVAVDANDANDTGDVTGTVGAVVLMAALAGILLATLAWYVLGRRSQVDHRPGGPAY